MYGRHPKTNAVTSPSALPRSIASPARQRDIEQGHQQYEAVARGRPYFHWFGRGLLYLTMFHGWRTAFSEYPVVNHLPSWSRRMTSMSAPQNPTAKSAIANARHPTRRRATRYRNSTAAPRPTNAPSAGRTATSKSAALPSARPHHPCLSGESRGVATMRTASSVQA